MTIFPQINQRDDTMDTDTLLAKLKDIAEDPTDYKISYGAMCYSPIRTGKTYKSCKCSQCNRKIGNFETGAYTDIVVKSGQIKKTGLAEVKIVCFDCLIELCKSGFYSYNIKDWDIFKPMADDYKKSFNKDTLDIDDLALLEWTCLHQKELKKQKRHSNINFVIFETHDYYESEYIVFFFKAANSDKPRLTVTYSYALEYFLAFIQNERTWESSRDATVLLRDNIDIIERLTGLKL